MSGIGWGSNFKHIDIGVYRTTRSNRNRYFIGIEYWDEDWLFISDGNSLLFLVDGKKIVLNGEGSSNYRRVISGEFVIEEAYYDIERNDLESIANGNTVKMRLVGQQYYTEKVFSEVQLSYLRQFLTQH